MMMDMDLDYERDMRIDESALDVEWLEQASLALKYGRHWAECNRAVLRADEKIKVVRSLLIKEANENPEKCCGKEKPTVGDIEAYYRNHPRHKQAKEDFLDAQYELDMATVAKNEISFTRKSALEQLVTLHGQQYFAGPSVPRDLTWEREEKQKKANQVVKITRRKKAT